MLAMSAVQGTFGVRRVTWYVSARGRLMVRVTAALAGCSSSPPSPAGGAANGATSSLSQDSIHPVLLSLVMLSHSTVSTGATVQVMA